MKRRKALKSIGLGVTAGLTLPWLSSCADEDTGPEIDYSGVVGIIGAGAAGLFAADQLIAKGIKVKIFEASKYIGGRVRSVGKTDPLYSNLIADFPLEFGAERIFGSDSEWGSIIKLYKVPLNEFRAGELNPVDKYILDDEYKTYAEIESDPDIVALMNFKNNILPGYTGGGSIQDAATAAGLNTRVFGILNSWFGNAYGTSIDKISANAVGESLTMIEHDGKELTMKLNSMSNVLNSRFNKAGGKVKLNKAVKSIDYSAENISLSIQDTVSGENSTETVSKLIVTVPVSILKAGDITFNPPLPSSKTTALSKIGMDASIRMILEFKRNDFYGSDTALIFGGTESPSYFITGSGRSEHNNTVSITINGPKAAELSLLTDEEKIEHVLDELDVAFGPPGNLASSNVRRKISSEGVDEGIVYVIQDWLKNEEFIKGGQSYNLPDGTNEDRISLAAPIGENLFFAGEATDITGEFGTVSGALKSGKRAAAEVIESIVGPA